MICYILWDAGVGWRGGDNEVTLWEWGLICRNVVYVYVPISSPSLPPSLSHSPSLSLSLSLPTSLSLPLPPPTFLSLFLPLSLPLPPSTFLPFPLSYRCTCTNCSVLWPTSMPMVSATETSNLRTYFSIQRLVSSNSVTSEGMMRNREGGEGGSVERKGERERGI